MKIIHIIKFIAVVGYGFFVATFLSCTSPQAYPVGTPNPLDEPGHVEPTAAELHLGNLRAITSDPARQ